MALLLDPTVDATFIAGTHGRDGRLALWGNAVAPNDEVPLVVPAGTQVRLRRVPVRLVEVRDVIDELSALPVGADVRPSVQAWSVAAKVALDLVARGRLVPSIGDDGIDTWRVGPLDTDDHARLDQLADALPAAAHAVPFGDGSPRRIVSARATLAAFVDSVADTLVRTAAAPLHAGHDAFAVAAPVDVSPQRDWLRSTTARDGQASTVLRVEMGAGSKAVTECVLEVHSRVDPGLVVPAADLWAAPAAVAARFGPEVDTEVLVTLRRAARVWAPIGRLLAETRPDRVTLTTEEEHELFGPASDELAAAGLSVLWPTSVFHEVDVRSVVTTRQPEAVTSGAFDLKSLGELRWRAVVDGEELTDEELAVLAEAKRPVVRMRGRWVRADPERLRRVHERRAVSAGEVLSAALSGTVTIDGEEVDAEIDDRPLLDLADRLAAAESSDEPWWPPEGLDADLRPYQQRGVQWLTEMAALGLGGVLADDMGLGKTVQVLALHLARNGPHLPGDQRGPTLVICPASVLGNWEREANRFAPGIAVHRHHGAGRDLDAIGAGDIVVTTYGVVRRDAGQLADIEWDLVVADEAQAVKNPYSRTAVELRRIPARARFALTGTPVENRLSDLWALLDWTTPGLLGRLDVFRRTVAIPVERDRDDHATDRLASVVRPFLLRRRKSDPTVAPDLPPKTETDQFVGLTAEQATLYRAVTEELVEEVERNEGIQRRGLVLKLLTALKQICNHPAQYLGQDGPIAGRSGKLDAVAELLGVITDEGDSALVFTQYVQMGRLLERHLATVGIDTAFLHGSTPIPRREEMVDDFQAGRPPVLIVSLKAGGTGLNLTRATHVVHYDRWWNPAVEDQASDRAWRIGQDRPVQVHRMMCEGTLEERIALVLDTKRQLADSVVGGGEAWITEMSDAELADLVALGGAR